MVVTPSGPPGMPENAIRLRSLPFLSFATPPIRCSVGPYMASRRSGVLPRKR